MSHPTFENTYRQYAFWPLVDLAMNVGQWLRDTFGDQTDDFGIDEFGLTKS